MSFIAELLANSFVILGEKVFFTRVWVLDRLFLYQLLAYSHISVEFTRSQSSVLSIFSVHCVTVEIQIHLNTAQQKWISF